MSSWQESFLSESEIRVEGEDGAGIEVICKCSVLPGPDSCTRKLKDVYIGLFLLIPLPVSEKHHVFLLEIRREDPAADGGEDLFA